MEPPAAHRGNGVEAAAGGAAMMARISAKPAGEPSGLRGKVKPLSHPHRRANLAW